MSNPVEWEIQTTKETREAVLGLIQDYGIVTEKWPDGSFNFTPYTVEDEDNMAEKLEDNGIDYKLV